MFTWAPRSTKFSRTSWSNPRPWPGFRAPFVPGWDCHGLPIEFKVVKQDKGSAAGGSPPPLGGTRAQVHRHPAPPVQAPGRLRRLGASLPHARSRLRGRDPARLSPANSSSAAWSTRAKNPSTGPPARVPRWPRPRSNTRKKIRPRDLRQVRRSSAARSRARPAWSSGPRRPGPCPANQAIAVNPGFGYRSQVYRNPHTGQNETLVLANALVREPSARPPATPASRIPPTTARFLGGELEGWRYHHPFLEREGPVILGEFVTLEAGTGCVHVAPGHGNEDYVVGRKYGLAVFSPVDDDGRFTEEVGVPVARRQVRFRRQPGGHRDAARTSARWRARDDPPHLPALLALQGADHLPRGGTILHPHGRTAPRSPARHRRGEMDSPWGRNRIYGTVESRPDWCISRQRTWGVPLPVFYDATITEPILRLWTGSNKVARPRRPTHGTNIWFDPDDTTHRRPRPAHPAPRAATTRSTCGSIPA